MVSGSSQMVCWNHRKTLSRSQQDDRRGIEAEQTVKRKQGIRRKTQNMQKQAKVDAKQSWKEKVKHITPVLVASGKTKDDKASSFPKIRDFLKKCKPSKTEFASWTAHNNVEK